MHQYTDIKLSPKNFRICRDASLDDLNIPQINLVIEEPKPSREHEITVLTKQKPSDNNALF